MGKIALNKPTLIMLYGYPGSGKTYLARQLCEGISAAHIHADRIRSELFEKPTYDKQETAVINHLMEYMTEEFLNAGISVIYDINSMRLSQRRTLRDLARRSHADSLLIWQQIDADSAFARTQRRDKRTADDKYAVNISRELFSKIMTHMQNPIDEDYVVVSGKHTYVTQKSSVLKKLYDQKLIGSDHLQHNVIKPGLVNLVPNAAAGRVDMSRRNISIG
jgi:predicted kinase